MRRSHILRSATLAVAVSFAATGCSYLTRSSVPSGGAPPEANGASSLPSLSGDGRYSAYVSSATNLVPGDNNNRADVFLTDHLANTTVRVSVASNGAQGNDDALEASVSGNGRFVAFSSLATNLVAGDTNNAPDVFMHDRVTGNTARISVNAGGNQGNAKSLSPSISATGQFVAFQSSASNLVPADTNNVSDVFQFDVFGGLTRLSLNNGGNQGNNDSTSPSISADGMTIAFQSTATNLVAGDTNAVPDVYVRDLVAVTTDRVSVSSAGGQSLVASADPAISGDGTTIAFTSEDFALVPGYGNGVNQVFVHSRPAGTTVPGSSSATGVAADEPSGHASLDETGRFVGFESDATDLVVADANAVTDVFVRDLTQPSAARVSLDKQGSEANGASLTPALSRDGRYVAFSSTSTNLLPADGNLVSDVFTRAAVSPTITSIAPATGPAGAANFVTIHGSGFLPGATVTVGSANVLVNGVNVVDTNTITAMFAIAPFTAPGPVPVLVTNAGSAWSPLLGGAAAVCVTCFTIV